jgi:hypothetical protein
VAQCGDSVAGPQQGDLELLILDPRQVQVPIDAVCDPQQTPTCDEVVHRACRQLELVQRLSAGDQTVLCLRKLAQNVTCENPRST